MRCPITGDECDCKVRSFNDIQMHDCKLSMPRDQLIVTTYSGMKIDLLNLKPSDIKIEDIAHSLSMQCRYNGHCQEFYSVAQHSVLVSDYLREVEEDEVSQLLGLMHDATEAYIGDIISPIKNFNLIAKHIEVLEESVRKAISEKFMLDWSPGQKRLVEYADKVLLVTEARDLLRVHWYTDIPRWDSEIRGIPQSQAKIEFIQKFNELTC